MRRRETFHAIVLRAITNSKLTRYEIAKRSGVAESALSRFASGERSLSLESLEKLRDVLGLDLRHEPPA